jgi:uncharacterized membrane protein
MTASTPGGLFGSATGAELELNRSQEPGSLGLERTIARLLSIGTYIAIALLLVGLALMLAHGIEPLSGGPAFDLGRLVADVTGLQPAGFIWLGLIVVIATPSARVLASLIGYARRGERAMAVVAALILVVIAISVALAKGLEG